MATHVPISMAMWKDVVFKPFFLFLKIPPVFESERARSRCPMQDSIPGQRQTRNQLSHTAQEGHVYVIYLEIDAHTLPHKSWKLQQIKCPRQCIDV